MIFNEWAYDGVTVYVEMQAYQHDKAAHIRFPHEDDQHYIAELFGIFVPITKYTFKDTDHVFVRLPYATGSYVVPLIVRKVPINRLVYDKHPLLAFETCDPPQYIIGLSGTYYTATDIFVLADGTIVFGYKHSLPVHVSVFTLENSYSATYTLYDTDNGLIKWMVDVQSGNVVVNSSESYAVDAFDEIDFGYDDQHLVITLYKDQEFVKQIFHDAPLDEPADTDRGLLKIYSPSLSIDAIIAYEGDPRPAQIVGMQPHIKTEYFFGAGAPMLNYPRRFTARVGVYEPISATIMSQRVISQLVGDSDNEMEIAVGEPEQIDFGSSVNIQKQVVIDNGIEITTYTVHDITHGIELKADVINPIGKEEIRVSIHGGEYWYYAIRDAIYEYVQKELISCRSISEYFEYHSEIKTTVSSGEPTDAGIFIIDIPIDEALQMDDIIFAAIRKIYGDVRIHVAETGVDIDVYNRSLEVDVYEP